MSIQPQEPPIRAGQSTVRSSLLPTVLSSRSWNDPFLWTILVLAAGLLFCSLGDRSLWQDEAETVLLAQGILRSGLPTAENGDNITSQFHGQEYGPDFVWRWSPWVQFYVAAGSMSLLGPTTLATRLPFAALGVVAVGLTYILARRLFASVVIARVSALLLALSVPFLLHTRQARWCAVAYALVPLLFLFLHRLTARQRFGMVGFALAGAALFYTNYFVAVGILGAVAPAAGVCWPQKAFLGRLSIAYLLCFLMILPGVVYFDILGKPHESDIAIILGQLQVYTTYFATYLIPLPLLILLVVLLVKRGTLAELGHGWKRWVSFLLAVSAAQLFYLSLGPWSIFRYLSVLLPVAAILAGLVVYWIWIRSVRVAILVLLLLVGTDVLHRLPLAYLNAPGTGSADEFPALAIKMSAADPLKGQTVTLVRFPLYGYLYEISHHVDDPEWVVAQYLREHARPQDIVIASYGDLPLQFYTGLQVVGGLQGKPLPADADWIFQRQFYLSSDRGDDWDTIQFIRQRVDLSRYEAIHLPGRESELGNNPDPNYHVFRISANDRPLLLFHKVSP